MSWFNKLWKSKSNPEFVHENPWFEEDPLYKINKVIDEIHGQKAKMEEIVKTEQITIQQEYSYKIKVYDDSTWFSTNTDFFKTTSTSPPPDSTPRSPSYLDVPPEFKLKKDM